MSFGKHQEGINNNISVVKYPTVVNVKIETGLWLIQFEAVYVTRKPVTKSIRNKAELGSVLAFFLCSNNIIIQKWELRLPMPTILLSCDCYINLLFWFAKILNLFCSLYQHCLPPWVICSFYKPLLTLMIALPPSQKGANITYLS